MSAILSALKTVSVEPVMLIDGACNQAMLLFIENVQMNKICSVNLGYSSEVCENLSDHPEQNVIVQKEFSVFSFYNSIILSVLSLSFVLFMGAWSDKYGRKIPLVMTLLGHVMYASGYLINNWQTSWPVEVIYVVTFLEALGGGNMGLLSSTISYISDITPEKSRTSRVSTANSMWYLGGPLGTLIGALVIQYASYNVALALVLAAYVSAVAYVFVFIKESHGPFANKALQRQGSLKDENISDTKEDVSTLTMIKDFFNWRRVVESFKTALKKREGNTRTILLAIILANMLRRVARGFFMYMFVRQALHWEATDYGYWVSYRNLLAALGSLFLVPLLTRLLSFSDSSLVILGSVSIIGEYICYGLITNAAQSFLIWLGPPASLISNASVIAFRSMSTKLVSSKEKGRINAVISAMNGLMPMVAYAAYSPIYYKTVDSFPAAQFFFGAGLNVIIMVLFISFQILNVSSSYDAKDLESGEFKPKRNILEKFERTTTITLKSLIRTLSGPLDQQTDNKKSYGTTIKAQLSNNLPKIKEIKEENYTSSQNIFTISNFHTASRTQICLPNPNLNINDKQNEVINNKQFKIDNGMAEDDEPKHLRNQISDHTFHEIPLDNEPLKDMKNV